MKFNFAIEVLEAPQKSLAKALIALENGYNELGPLDATPEQIEAAKPIVREKKAQIDAAIEILSNQPGGSKDLPSKLNP